MGINMTNPRRKVQHLLLTLLLLAVPAGAQTTIETMVAAVSDSALFATITGLQEFGTRWCLEGNSTQVSKWVRGQFTAAGLTDVTLDPFVYNNVAQANVVATLPGTRVPDREIIVGAHIDSRGQSALSAPGADDNASGTAAVIEIARVLVASGYRPSATIRFIGFAAEEVGLKGSTRYAQNAKGADRDIRLMINFDMIGYSTSANTERRFYVVHYPPDTEPADLVASAATNYTSLTPVMTTRYSANVDSYSFVAQGYSSVTCIEYDFNPYYHSAGDLVTMLDTAYVRDITRTGLAAILMFDGLLASAHEPESTRPGKTALLQNYPNPFNPSTVVGSQYSVVSYVKLAVYDLLGREVAVLVDEQRAPGRYEDTFDATGLASGVYIYRLVAGNHVESKRMMLVR